VHLGGFSSIFLYPNIIFFSKQTLISISFFPQKKNYPFHLQSYQLHQYHLQNQTKPLLIVYPHQYVWFRFYSDLSIYMWQQRGPRHQIMKIMTNNDNKEYLILVHLDFIATYLYTCDHIVSKIFVYFDTCGS